MSFPEKLAPYRGMIGRIELVLIVAAVLLFAVFFSPNINSFVQSNVYYQKVGMTFDESAKYLLSPKVDGLAITSLSLTGKILGDGAVKVYLESDGTRLLAFTNVHKKGLLAQSYTAVSSSNIQQDKVENAAFELVLEGAVDEHEKAPEGYDVFGSEFRDECVDTCLLPDDLFKNNNYSLVVSLEPGTKLSLDEISFSMPK